MASCRPSIRPASRLRAAILAVLLLAVAPRLAAAQGAPPDSAADPGRLERLGRAILPLQQKVELRLDPAQPEYSGSTTITLEAEAPFTTLRLHAKEMTVETILLAGGLVHVAPKWTTGPDGTIVLTFAEPVPAGGYILTLRFRNDFNTRATSLYRLKAGDDWYAFTQFEATDAREAFPCFDEPEFKIPWTLELTVPNGHKAIANTPIEASTPAEEGWTKHVFKRSKPMPTYIVAMATGPLELAPIEGLSVPGNIVTVKGQSHLAGEAIRATPPLLGALEAYFGRPYPYEKLDLLALPEFWPGAMENAGAITFADRVLLLDDKTATLTAKRSLASITAHEIAHMWFGDLVTMRWWDDLWLNESFASWLGEKITNEVFPEYGIEDRLVLDADDAMRVDGKLSTRAIRQPVQRLDNLLQSADALAYDKGQTVLGMFEQWLGPDVFRAGVRDYISRHAWGNAVAADLWSALSRASKKDVGATMGTFLNQPGLALVEVEPLPGGRVRLTQSRFLPAGTTVPTPQRWSIPMTLKYGGATGAAKMKSVLLTAPTQVVTLDPGAKWVYPNGRAWGYYRWKMPDASVASLVERAGTTLDVRERVELTANAAALLDAGAMPGDTYLRVLETLAADEDPAVVGAVLDGLTKVKDTFITPEVEAAFATYVDRALTPALDRFGLERRAGEKESVSFLRGRLLGMLADEGKSARARAYADSLAKAYLADAASVDPAMAFNALQIAALGDDPALWETYRQRFEAAQSPGERRNFLQALGAFRAPPLRDKALDYALAGPLRPQGGFARPRAVGSDEAGREAQFQWATKNYEAILKRVPPMYAVFMPYVGSGCSGDRLAATQEFFGEPGHAPPGTEKELAKVTEAVEDCMKLRAREGGRVREFLQRTPVAN